MKGGGGIILTNALRARIAETLAFSGDVRVDWLGGSPWASITFSGARHRLRVSLRGSGAVGAAADLLDRLDQLELSIPGLILADLSLRADSRRDDGAYAWLDLDALTVNDE